MTKTLSRCVLLTLALGLLAACGGTETPAPLAQLHQASVISGSDCGNGMCSIGETAEMCLQDCFCGNGTCDADESSSACAADCAPGCNDGVCDLTEDEASCPVDCSTCTDALCNEFKKKKPRCQTADCESE